MRHKLRHKRKIVFFSLGAFALILTIVLLPDRGIPKAAEPESVSTVLSLENPTARQMWYGDLVGYPHTFEFTITEASQEFRAHIMVPDIPGAPPRVSGLLVRVLDTGGVVSVARLHARDSSWESHFNSVDGNWYLLGPELQTILEAGTYRFELSTPDNVERYAVSFGTEAAEPLGYLEKIRRIAGTKEFFGKSQFMILQSPVVYIPVAIIVGKLLVLGYYIRRYRTVV